MKVSNPFEDPTSLGNVLLRLKKITKEQLLDAVGVHAQHSEYLLVALLAERKVVSPADIAKALEIQDKMRTGDRLLAELDLLDAALDETQKCNERLAAVIRQRRDETRERGDNSGNFLTPVTA